MAKRKNKKDRLIASLIITFWLLWCGTGSVIFFFGVKDLIDEATFRNWLKLIIGGIMVFVAVYLGKWMTETSLALNKKKK